MTSKSSFSNDFQMLKEGCRRHVWITIISCVGFLLSIILPVMLVVQRYQEALKRADTYYTLTRAGEEILGFLSFYNPICATGLIGLAIVGGIGVFSYLHYGKQSDFFHSLPISRSRLFKINYLIVPAIVIPSYVIINLLGVALACMMGFSSMIRLSVVLFGMIQSIIFFLATYSIAVLGAILCGNRIISVLLLVWMYFSPTCWVAIITTHFEFLRTFITPMWISNLMLKLSPILLFYSNMNEEYSLMRGVFRATTFESDWPSRLILSNWQDLALYLVVFAAISALTWYLFQIRPSEGAGNALAFVKTQMPIQVYMTAFIALVGGLLLTAIAENSYVWMVIGILIGGLIMHGVAEAIYAFDVRAIFRHLPHLGISVALALILAFGIRMDVMGYDTKRVALDEIESADFYCYNLRNSTVYRGHYAEPVEVFTSAEAVEDVWQLANYCVDYLETAIDYDQVPQQEFLDCIVTFHLDSGSTMRRAYSVYHDEARKLAEELSNTPEYLQEYHELYQGDFEQRLDDPDATPHLTINTYYEVVNLDGRTDTSVTLYDRSKCLAIWQAAQRDCMKAELSYLKNNLPVFYISNDYGARIPIYECYEETIRKVAELTDYENFVIDPARVAKMEIHYDMRALERQWEDLMWEEETVAYVLEAQPHDAAVSYITTTTAPAAPVAVTMENYYETGFWTAEVTEPADMEALLEGAVPVRALHNAEYDFAYTGEIYLWLWLDNGQRVADLYYLEGERPEALLARYYAQAQPEGQ